MIHFWRNLLDEYSDWICKAYGVPAPIDALWNQFTDTGHTNTGFHSTFVRRASASDPRIMKLKEIMQKKLDQVEPNKHLDISDCKIALIHYANEKDFMGWHQDSPHDFTIIVSFGATRVLLFRDSETLLSNKESVDENNDHLSATIFQSGDVIVFDHEYNKDRLHMLPPIMPETDVSHREQEYVEKRRLAVVMYRKSKKPSLEPRVTTTTAVMSRPPSIMYTATTPNYGRGYPIQNYFQGHPYHY